MENFENQRDNVDKEQEKERQERIKEIDKYVDDYFEKYKASYELSGHGCTQNTDRAYYFWEDVNYADYFYEELHELLEEKLSGKNLVDLGVGNRWENIPSKLTIPIKKYTAVDIKLPSEEAIEHHTEKFQENEIESEFVESDMLKYVSRLPDNSSNFFLSAIDYDVILDEKYWKYLCEEMYRTTEKEGIVINAGPGNIKHYFDKFIEDKFELIYGRKDKNAGEIVLEKIN